MFCHCFVLWLLSFVSLCFVSVLFCHSTVSYCFVLTLFCFVTRSFVTVLFCHPLFYHCIVLSLLYLATVLFCHPLFCHCFVLSLFYISWISQKHSHVSKNSVRSVISSKRSQMPSRHKKWIRFTSPKRHLSHIFGISDVRRIAI